LFKPYVQQKLAIKPYVALENDRYKDGAKAQRDDQSLGTIVRYRGTNDKSDKSDLSSVASTLRLREKAIALQK
jgi:hypothetical protein